MTQITVNSPKHCASKKGLHIIERSYKKFFFIISSCFSIVLFLVLLIWFILRPSKSQFSLKELDIYQLNLSGPYLNSTIQLTLLSKNPNQKVGIYYDEFQVYATYKSQRITMDYSVPPFYQRPEERNLLSAAMVGEGLPVSPSLVYELGRDRAAARLVLNVKVNGKLRWKVGTWVSGCSRFNVNCVSFLTFGPSVNSGPVSSNQGAQCSTDV